MLESRLSAVRRFIVKGTSCTGALALLLSYASSAAAAPKKRDLPDYGARDGGTTVGEVLLWVPRVALFPLYLVSEFIIRRPLGWAIAGAERAHLPAALYDFFAFGPDHKSGFVPVAFIDFGFRPSVGVHAFWHDAGWDGHNLSLHLSTGGSNWFVGSFAERISFRGIHAFKLEASAGRRLDYTYFGLGPLTAEDDIARFGADSAEARVGFESRVWRGSGVETTFGFRSAAFRQGDYHGQATIEDRVQAGTFALPPGYGDGYEAIVSRMRLVLDTRRADVIDRSGVRLELQGEQGTDLKQTETAGWLRYGATLGGALDLGRNGRVVSLSVSTLFADPLLNSRPVPFIELPTLGGPGLMPGFRAGRLRDRSAAVATLRYSWPIWVWLNGSLQAAVGNVFGERLQGFDVSEMRFSSAIGIDSEAGGSGSALQVLFGIGTRPFDEGGKIESVRLTLGVRNGI